MEIKPVRVLDEKTGKSVSSSNNSNIKPVRVLDEKTGRSVKKKSTMESPSEQDQEDVSSVTSITETKKPSVSSGSVDRNLFRGDAGAGEQTYRLDKSSGVPVWKEYSSTMVDYSGKKPQYDVYDKTITDPTRVKTLNKFFKQNASASEVEEVFTGFPGKEANRYRVFNGSWQRMQPNAKEWTTINEDNAVTALNRQFKKDIKPIKGLNVIKEGAKFTDINTKLVSQTEGNVVPYLQKKYSKLGFTFEEAGVGQDYVTVTSKDGKTVDVSLDEANPEEALKLRHFISQNASADHSQKTKYLKAKREEDPNYAKTPEYINALKSLSADEVEDLIDERKASTPTKDLNAFYNSEEYKVYKEKKSEKQKERATKVDQLYYELNNAKTAKDKQYIKSKINTFLSDDIIQKQTDGYNMQLMDVQNAYKKINSEYTNLNSAAASGKLTQEQYDERLSKLNQKRVDLKDSSDGVIAQMKKLEKVTGKYLLDKEKMGSFGGNLLNGLAVGISKMIETPAMLQYGMPSEAKYERLSPEEKKFILNKISSKEKNKSYDDLSEKEKSELKNKAINYVGNMTSKNFKSEVREDVIGAIGDKSTTKEYSQSKDRGFFETALVGIAESLPAMIVPGGGAVRTLAMGSQAYASIEDEMLNDPDFETTSMAERSLIAVPYATAMGILEEFGFSKMISKDPLAKSLVMKSITKVLSKKSTTETLESALEKELKSNITKYGLKVVGGTLAEAETGALQSAIGDVGFKTAYNQIRNLYEGKTDEEISELTGGGYFNTPDNVKEASMQILEDAAAEAIGGGVMTAAMTGFEKLSNGEITLFNDDDITKLKELSSDPEMKKMFVAKLRTDMVEGKITKEQAKTKLEALRSAEAEFNRIPDNITGADLRKSMELSIEKKELTKEIEGKDENLVAPKKARIEEINNELKTIGENADKITEKLTINTEDATKESNKQEDGTESDIVQREGTDEGQQEVGQGKGAVGETEKPSADTGDSNISSQEEEIIIPTEELDILNEEISKRKDEGTVLDNLDQKAFIGNEPGMIKIDPENENTVVFETKDKIIELGNIDEIKEKDIASLNLSLFPESGVIVNDKTKAVTVDGKEYTIIGRRRDKKGQSVVRVKEVDTGLERRIIGEKAEIILKDAALAPKQTVAPIETKVSPEQEVAKPIKEKITTVTETKEFNLEELQAEEDRLNAEAAKFEEELLKQISKESKKEKKLTFKVKDSEFSVTAKSDGTFSVSQKNAEGKFVGIKDDAKRKRVVSEYKKLREGNDSNRLKDAEDLSNMFKKEQDDKILSLLDRAIEATSGKGKAFDATLGLPIFVANTSLKIIKASYKAGKSLSEAIKDGYKFVKDNNYKISEYEFKKFVAENVNKKQETPDVTTKEAVTKEAVSEEEDVKINPKDMSALKTQIKNEGRAIRDKVKEIKQVLNDISNTTKELVTKGSITLKQSQAIINAVKKINFNSDESIKKSIDYISKIYKNADFANKVSTGKSLRKDIKKKIKDAPGHFKNTAKAFAEIDPRWVESIDAYNEIAELVKDSVTKASARKGKLTAKDEADINQVNIYTLKEQERQQEMSDNMLRERYADLMDITFDEATKIDIKEIKKQLADNKITEDFSEANKEAIKEGIEKYNDMVDEDTDERVKDILNFDLELLSTKFQLEMIDALDSYFANGAITNLDKLTGAYKGIKGINDFVGKARSLKLLFSRSTGNLKAKQLTNFNLIVEKIFVNRSTAQNFLKSIGFYDIVNGVNKADIQSKNKENDFAKKFKKEIKNGMLRAENAFEAGVIANLSRQMATGDNVKFFNDRLNMLKDSLEVMKRSERNQDIIDADVYENVFKKLGLYDDNVTLESIKEKAEPMNVAGAEYMVEMMDEIYPELSDLSLSMYNTQLAKDRNYTPDRYKAIKKSSEDEIENMNESGFQKFNYFGNLKADKSGVLIESTRPSKLPKDRYVDLNLYSNTFNSYKLALKDLYTAKSIEQANAFVNNEKFDKLFENNANRELVKQRLIKYVADAKGKGYSIEEDLKFLNKASEIIGMFSGARALVGASQAVSQFATAITNTITNAAEHIRANDLFNSKFWEATSENGLPIKNVGLDVVSTLSRERDSIERAKGDGNLTSKVGGKLINAIKIPNEFLLKYTLQEPDKAARLIGFAAYYRKYMKDNGFKGNPLDAPYNIDAANYAQSMVDRNMDVTDTKLRGDLYTSKKIEIKLIKQILFPFSSFRMNLRARVVSDLRILSSKSKYEVNSKQKIEAARSLAAVGTEMAVYNGIRFVIGKAMIFAAAGILGYDDEEVKEFVDKQSANLWKSVISNSATELLSPVPYTDDKLLTAFNWILEETGVGNPSDKALDEYIKEQNNIRKASGKEPFTEEEEIAKRKKFMAENLFQFYVDDEVSYGALGIQPKKFMELYDVVKAYKTGEYEDEYKGNVTKKKLTQKGKESLKEAAIMKFFSTTIGDRDTDKLSNTIFKLVKKKEGLTEDQKEKYDIVKEKYNNIDPYKQSLIESSMKPEKIMEQIDYIEDTGGFTKSQSKEYAKLRSKLAVDYYMIDKIRDGISAEQILNNPD